VNRALFLDRDGVINVDRNYVHRREDFDFLPGIFDLCLTAQDARFIPIVITNQAGIGRGIYSEDDFQQLTGWMLERFLEHGVRIGRVYHCPYHPTAGIGAYRRDSFDRKPNPGMILKARDEFALDLAHCVLVGDKDTDIAAGRAAGVRHNLRLLHGAAAVPAADGLQFRSLHAIREWLERPFGRLSRG
jgi:D-glycero-D-manno-heptose 1,7-bisphosphate phosphatase